MASQTSHKPHYPPECDIHHLTCKIKIYKNTGPNFNRRFWICPLPLDKNPCKYCKWDTTTTEWNNIRHKQISDVNMAIYDSDSPTDRELEKTLNNRQDTNTQTIAPVQTQTETSFIVPITENHPPSRHVIDPMTDIGDEAPKSTPPIETSTIPEPIVKQPQNNTQTSTIVKEETKSIENPVDKPPDHPPEKQAKPKFVGLASLDSPENFVNQPLEKHVVKIQTSNQTTKHIAPDNTVKLQTTTSTAPVVTTPPVISAKPKFVGLASLDSSENFAHQSKTEKNIQNSSYNIVVPEGVTIIKESALEREQAKVSTSHHHNHPYHGHSNKNFNINHHQNININGVTPASSIEPIFSENSAMEVVKPVNHTNTSAHQASTKNNFQQSSQQPSFSSMSGVDSHSAPMNVEPAFPSLNYKFGSNGNTPTFDTSVVYKPLPPVESKPTFNFILPPINENPYINDSLASLQHSVRTQEGLMSNNAMLQRLPDKGLKVYEKLALLKQAEAFVLDKTIAKQITQDNNKNNVVKINSNNPHTESKTQYMSLEDSAYLQSISKPANKSSSNSHSLSTSAPHSINTDDLSLDKLFRSLSISIETLSDSEADSIEIQGLKSKLFNYQKTALKWMETRETRQTAEIENNNYNGNNRNNKTDLPLGGIIADDCGLGKTLQLLAFILMQKQNHKYNANTQPVSDSNINSAATLVICPKSLMQSWENQIAEHIQPNYLSCYCYYDKARSISAEKLGKYDIILTTYATVRGEHSNNRSRDTLFSINFNRIALDEGHNIRNSKAEQSLAVYELCSINRWYLSATPIQNEIIDFYSIFHFLRFRPYDQISVFNQMMNSTKTESDRYKSMQKLKFLLSIIMLRRMKSDSISPDNDTKLVDLPPKYFKTHLLKFTTTEQQFYDELYSSYKKAIINGSKSGDTTYSAALVMLLRLRQCCDHYMLVIQSEKQKSKKSIKKWKEEVVTDEDEDNNLEKELKVSDSAVQKAMRKINFGTNTNNTVNDDNDDLDSLVSQLSSMNVTNPGNNTYTNDIPSCVKISFLMEKVDSISKSNSDDKIIIFSQFTSMLDLIGTVLGSSPQYSSSFTRLDGSMSTDQQSKAIEEFNNNNDIRIFLISLKSGGVGLNLTRANHCVLMDAWWNPAIELQAYDRIHRVGQKKPVFIHRLAIRSTVEESLLTLQAKKQKLADMTLDEDRTGSIKYNNKNNTGTTSEKQKLTFADLRALFQ